LRIAQRLWPGSEPRYDWVLMARIDKHRWSVLSPLLDELLDADDGVRVARLAHIRDTDRNLADDLSALLHRQSAIDEQGFLEGVATPRPAEPTLVGRTVGSYTLERSLGRGGMGAVWLAHRSDGRYAGRVAVKLLNLSLLGRGGTHRFKREGTALARLTHPNIARLIDAGVTSDGQPYLVLEYVEGEPIDRWCADRALDVEARVSLFLQVLDAVAHAHSKLILHADLKPANILVTSAGQVKLLDFGIAKLMDEKHPHTSAAATRFPGHAFTPEYAAPEQVQGAEVTTATDVYALGVLLYSLLTSRHPTADPSQTPLDRLRAVVDIEPIRASETVRALRGDLDTIIAKALKKLPSERYATVAALGEDLQRYLRKQPVSARADSISYRVERFVSRNRAAVGAATVALLSIVAASGVSMWQAHEARMQRDHARALSARNNVVVEFVSSMLTEVVPAEQPVRIADLLERSQSVLLGAETRPDMQAAILNILATYFLNSGDVLKAQPLLTRSLELTRNSADVGLRAELLCGDALAASMRGERQAAEALLSNARALATEDAPTPARCVDIAAQLAEHSP
jgi:eukaryotic-like serine/threonine-protein kinase